MAEDDYVAFGSGGSAPTSSGGGYQPKPRDPRSAELDDNATIEIRNRYQPTQSGAFPSWFPPQLKRRDAVSLLERMSSVEIIYLKQRLWAAGFLVGGQSLTSQDGLTAIPNTESAPTSPVMDVATKDAFLLFFDEAATSKGVNGGQDTLDSYMNRSISARSAERELAFAQTYNYADALEGIQQWAYSKLGRYFSDEETQELLRKTANANTSYDNPLRTQYGGYGSAQGDAAVAAQQLRGGSPDSTAQSFLNQLARVYGLQPLSNTGEDAAFRDYRGLTMTGNADQVIALSKYVGEGQLGPNTIWERNDIEAIDPNNPDAGFRLVLAVKDNVEAPQIAGIDVSATQSFGDDVSKFLSAANNGNYQWNQQQGNAFGAYGLSQQIWDYYTTSVFKNIDPNDHGKEAQDAVARAYANDLYSGHHNWQNWEDVAYAFVLNEDVARSNRDIRNSVGDPSAFNGRTPNDSRTRVANLLQKMANPVVTNGNLANGMRVADPYTQMFGNGTGAGAAYMSDPYAIRPRNQEEFAVRLQRLARESTMGEQTVNGMFSGLENLISKFGYEAVVQAGKG
jgi:hypothetical protein